MNYPRYHRVRRAPRYWVFACLAFIGFVSFCLGWQTTTQAVTSTHPKTIRRVSAATTVTPLVGNTITVNSNSDEANSTDGLCTLREAIAAANTDTASGVPAGECGAGSNSGSDTISLTSVTGTITLGSALPTITSEMTFNGPGLSQLTISGNNTVRVFNITLGTGLVSFSGLTIANGRANMDVGGGIFNQNGADVNVTDSTVRNNFAVLGGGIANSSSGTFTITNSTLNNNSATTAAGCWNNSGTLNIVGSTLNNNTSGEGAVAAGGSGGGINTGNGTLNVINSTLHNNSALAALAGGGAIFTNGSSATINITNSTISNNFAVAGGGGINSNNGGVVNVLNSIIADNGSQSGPDLLGSFVSLGHNLLTNISGSTGFTLGTNNPNGDLVGASFAPVFAILGPLQNNGGPTQTRALLPGSPAIDAGDNCVLLASGSGGCLTTPLTTDQRGFSRQVNLTVDMGAFESRGFTLSATSGTPQSKPVNTLFAPLVVTVSSAAGDPVAGGLVIFNSPTSGPTAIFGTGTSDITESINASGQASTAPTANGIAGGPYNVTATSKGAASSASFSLTNLQAATTTVVTSSSNPSDLTQSVTFTATVTSTGTPTGTVQFKIDGSNAGSPVSLSGGVATLTTSALTAGIHSVTADYSGDTNFLPSTGTLTGGQVVRPPPTLSINDISFTEGDTGSKFVFFTVTSSASSNLAVNVDFATANDTASSPSDYLATTGSITFVPGQVIRTIFVTINSDVNFELNESFTITLSNPVNAILNKSQGTGTILNDDAEGGFIRFSQSNLSVNEATGQLTVTITRSNDTSRPATVDYATGETGAPTACGSVNGVASHRCDFTTAMGTLRFGSGETSKTLNLLVNRDSYAEGSEILTMSLSNPTGGAVLIAPSSAMVTITDSATGPPPNLIDDATVFVRQHYHDFLNREPDAAGLAFWTNEITSCGSDPACIEIKRINVSAAFFLSIEFQETGYLAYRMFKAAYGDATSPNVPGTVPIIRLREFLPDAQRMGEGVQVGIGDWEQQLETNKRAYALEFVQRARFLAAYPTSMTAEEFVTKLEQNVGGALSSSEKAALIALLGSTPADPEKRAQVVRGVADDADLRQAEFNRAFVLMQYYGYLRRNPDDPPDTNFGGWKFWLDKLNQFNGNFINAEMVKAFISSLEYRNRFGQ
ncbi:MAG TPA: Calx-beta domain-containing protein [Pyrinomonadaceae bacterium]|nr:Calx-beta domain-containing protein [Pyrinomonadaceae bacterium]